MGWASGSVIFSDVIKAVRKDVPAPRRVRLYKKLILSFEESDWDTQDECLGMDPAYDKALKSLHPDWYSDE